MYHITHPQPVCKTCGKLMQTWNPYAVEHEHPECAGKRTAQALIDIIRNKLKNQNKSI